MSDTIAKIGDSLRVLREDETAELLNIHVQTLRKWRRDRSGPPFIRLGSRLYGYRVGDVQAWQEARQAA